MGIKVSWIPAQTVDGKVSQSVSLVKVSLPL